MICQKSSTVGLGQRCVCISQHVYSILEHEKAQHVARWQLQPAYQNNILADRDNFGCVLGARMQQLQRGPNAEEQFCDSIRCDAIARLYCTVRSRVVSLPRARVCSDRASAFRAQLSSLAVTCGTYKCRKYGA